MREVIVTSSNLFPAQTTLSGSIHQEEKPENESTTKWDILVLDFTTLLLRDTADGRPVTARAVWVLPL